MQYFFDSFTHQGKVRDNNEDAFRIDRNAQTFFAVVADGMGGHRAGETASSKAVALLQKGIMELGDETTFELLKTQVEEIVKRVNKDLYCLSVNNEAYKGMGTTLTFLIIQNQHAIIGNIGDSRCYLLRKSHLQQQTKDHSLVQEMFDKGEITQEQMQEHPQKNIITRAVGTDLMAVLDTKILALEYGDLLLLCSDGLTNCVADNELKKILNQEKTVEEITQDLGKAALEGGGIDNITLILVQCTADEESDGVG